MALPHQRRACLAVLLLAWASGSCKGTPGPGPVPSPQAPVRIELQDYRLPPGTTRQLSAIGYFNDNTSRDVSSEVTWTSSHPAVVQVAQGGRATAVSLGEAFVTASRQAARATATVMVLPDGTWKVSGIVRDEGVTVEAVTVTAVGSGIPVSAVTNKTGQYALYGVAGSVEIRAELAGYRTSTRPMTVTGDTQLDFDLLPESTRPYEGRYEMTVTSSNCNLPLPEDLRTRTYVADIVQRGAQLSVTLSGATFLRNAFTGTVTGGRVQFTLDDGYYYYYYKFGDRYDVVELIDDRYFIVAGEADLTGPSTRLEGPLHGSLVHGIGTPPAKASYCFAPAHGLRFVRTGG